MTQDWGIRELQGFSSQQYCDQYFALLSHLTVAPGLSPNNANSVLERMNTQGTKIFVAESEGMPIGTCSLVLEQKLIREGGIVARIEDVATSDKHRGKGIGLALVQRAVEAAREAGAYKVVLDCCNHNVAFYEKLGFKLKDNFMRLDLNS